MSGYLLIISFSCTLIPLFFLFFFFNDTATTEIYTLSLHDALPIYERRRRVALPLLRGHRRHDPLRGLEVLQDRKSTRLNSSHSQISYAVFCLKKKKRSSKIPYSCRWLETSDCRAEATYFGKAHRRC